MRKLILKMSMSLDGFVADPKSDNYWIFPSIDEGASDWTIKAIWQAGIHIMGSHTFHDMASYWPSSTEIYAPPMNEIPKAVFSKDPAVTSPEKFKSSKSANDQKKARTGRTASANEIEKNEKSWTNARVMSGDLATDIAQLKSEPGRDIIAHGGASFARSLVKLGLVDEYQLLVHPVSLGQGLPIFSELTKPAELQLVSAHVFPGGAVAHVYRAGAKKQGEGKKS